MKLRSESECFFRKDKNKKMAHYAIVFTFTSPNLSYHELLSRTDGRIKNVVPKIIDN